MKELVRSTFLLTIIMIVGGASAPVASDGGELEFLIKPRLVYLQAAGSKAKLKCKATQESNAVIKWYRGEQKTPIYREWINTTRYFVKRDGTLVIKNALKSAEGFYYCTISNKLGTKRARAAVAVIGQSPPRISTKSTIIATTGSNITIHCHADISSMQAVYWKSNTNAVYSHFLWSGTPLPGHVRVYAQYSSASTSDLKIQDAKYSDTGIYTCLLTSIPNSKANIRQVEVSVRTDELLKNSVQDVHPMSSSLPQDLSNG